jgi:hypothetical protein
MTVATPEITQTPVETVQTETVKPLKLSEALRLGTMNTKQAYRTWKGPEGEMCAMSTAWYALTGGEGNSAAGTPLTHLLGAVSVQHPAKPGITMDLKNTIMDLNDSYRWDRNRIADWLEGLGL